MATPTYVPLATLTLSSGSDSITFSSIPTDGTYRDLVLIVSGTPSANRALIWRANGDSGSNYSYVELYGAGASSSTATSENRGRFTNQNVTVSTDFSLVAQFIDYSSSDKHKVVLSRVSNSSNLVAMSAGRYSSTTAISSIEVFISTANYQTKTTFSLYGIAG